MQIQGMEKQAYISIDQETRAGMCVLALLIITKLESERPLAGQGAQCGVFTHWIMGGVKTDSAACGNMLNHRLPDSREGKTLNEGGKTVQNIV